ncbi:CbrC family protein [Streptomyces griseorubiginosus]|uniref:CbrC family protein n=1 Tax=Streptomyces griseorubiginosus TaxID=67304 RepID=UPI002E805907|nr:CbrC family protein [Streptomyces griseorubiginosus]WUB44925.1 CbrC family protein [Streptomyces griseorubiginosus]WUB53442.1 CbrC family protein [Streptomyces griseorubiginosus]
MSYSLYLCRFVGGQPAPMDESAIRGVLAPVTVGGMPPTGLPDSWELEAGDGGGSEVYGDALGLTFNRFSTGQILDRVAELARRTGAAVLPLGCPAILTSEADRGHLPESLRAEAVVVAPEALTGQAIQLLISPQPEPRRRPALPSFPYHPNPVATGSVTPYDGPCACCGQERGWVYTGPVYATDAPDSGICPHCIAFGTAAERWDATFTAGVEGAVPADVVTTILRRTPGFLARRSPTWLTHCGDGAEFLGSLDKDGRPTAYLFRCRVCATSLSYADST